jgi:hypothetical protein
MSQTWGECPINRREADLGQLTMLAMTSEHVSNRLRFQEVYEEDISKHIMI